MKHPDRDVPPDPAARDRRPSRTALFVLASVLVVAGAWLVRGLVAPPAIVDNPSSSDGRLAPSFIDADELDRLISAYERRITTHTDALDFRTLGYLYLEKARTTGDVSRYVAAREAFERAVDLFPTDPSSRVGMAASHYGLHDFATARNTARQVYDATGRLDALAIVTDAAYALGDYEVARNELRALSDAAGDQPGVLVRRAEAARIDGDREGALTLSDEALAQAAETNNPRLLSWYEAFAAQMRMHLGGYEDGLALAESSLARDPESDTARLVTARLRAANGDLAGAIELYELLAEPRPDPTYLSELGDLYLLVGREDNAQDAHATVEVAAELAEAEGVYDRVISNHLADHEIATTRAVEIARGELERRQDVGAHDALAWALFADGRYGEAAESMQRAMARGTLDARFHYHAGLIAAALGDADEARTHLEAALTLSPEFQPLQADRARRTLAGLE